MLLADLVATSNAVAATRSRKAKVAALAQCLAAASREELPVVSAYLAGSLLQRRTGLGWRSLAALPAPVEEPSLRVGDVHEAFERMSLLSGDGSQAARSAEAEALFGAATEVEQAWLRGVVTGEVRQGALDSLVQEGLAVAAEVPLAAVRRAAMLAGSTVVVAGLAFDGEQALAEVGLVVGRPVMPMLASSATSVTEAMAKIGAAAVIDTKLDGIRIQAHRDGDDVVIATRTLDDITARLPEVVEVVRNLPASSVVLDGEAMLVGADGRPRPFQETASRTATRGAPTAAVVPFFFDVLHLDGTDLLGRPLRDRLAALDALVPQEHRAARLETADPEAAERFAADVLVAGQEGVVVKGTELPWEAGRRGSGWIKVKPVHTLDLVVLGIEWGSGRRKGWLSNIHLGARDPEGGFTMIGKTFKGMTDQILAWQTERFTELAVDGTDGWQVKVRPEQVVEIAFDGVQRSTRYPGGVALRFARVVRYRDDKRPDEADTIGTIRMFLD
ncbi:DNA ligase-1 [Nocardioides albertanoniae]|uniref:DNA ligase n=1 Tax=Nocardioides albertanoniae TaxID=1175486 RepID=A0A543A7E1_9ACTN|nr:ATP-dependent DNA ligase [Nocardioides albertanoniae]TQL68429.1 DNA ligase-1 [Nocardioides albertanoniae]